MSYERTTSCPLCDGSAWCLFGYDEPDPLVGYTGGSYLIEMRCDGPEPHTEDDLSGAQLRDLERGAAFWYDEEMEARYDAEMDRRMDAERLGER